MIEFTLLPRATLRDVLGGKARLVGSRFDTRQPRGWLSPVEPRLRMGIPYGDLRAAEADYLAQRSFRADLGVLARTALAWVLSPSSGKPPARRPYVVSACVDNISINEAVDGILAAPEAGRARTVFFVHAHALNLARFDAGLRAIFARADTVLPDGIGIRLAARILGVAMRHNVNGTDLFPVLCEQAGRRGIPVIMVGGKPGIADACAQRMRNEYADLNVPFVSHGYLDAAASGALARRIADLGRSLVLVGMGSPQQERWAWEHLRNVPGATVLTVGGLFDFYSGCILRAPIRWREMGLEWAWRLLQEPRRLAKRYLLGNPLFLSLALAQRLYGIGR